MLKDGVRILNYNTQATTVLEEVYVDFSVEIYFEFRNADRATPSKRVAVLSSIYTLPVQILSFQEEAVSL